MKKYQKTALIEVVSTANDGDYLVQNEGQNNDQWIIPKGVFETTYEEVKHDFGWAVRQLKLGKKVAREGWNGKGMYLTLIPAGNAMWQGFPMQDCIGMKTANGLMQPGWLASQADMLAEDWSIAGE